MESRTDVCDLEIDEPIGVSKGERGPRPNSLRIGDIMSKDVVTAAPDETISSVAKKMSEHNISCVVITDQGRVMGILTERDMLNGVAGRDIEFHRLKASERMSSPVNTISPEASILEAGRIMETNCIRRVPVVQDGHLVGIVTETDITRGLISLSPLRYVSDIMTKHIASVEAEATTDEAARVMSCRNISCLVVMHRQEVAGIITEKDLLKRIVALHKNPTQTFVVDVMSFPVVTVPPTCSLLGAIKKMETMHLHRLLIAEGKTVCGIVTQTDIMQIIRGAFEAAESQRRAWAAELADLVQHITRDTAKVRELLDNLEYEADKSGQTADAALATEQTGHGVFIL